jgi:hypothetical protein
MARYLVDGHLRKRGRCTHGVTVSCHNLFHVAQQTEVPSGFAVLIEFLR